jgi:hypothetical protein
METRVWGAHSGLGPEMIKCPKCATVYRTDRKEWPRLNGDGRFSYLFMSGFYLALVLGLSFVFTFIGFSVLKIEVKGLYAWCFMLFMGILLVSVQTARVRASIRRVTPALEIPPYQPKLFQTQAFLYMLFGLLIVLGSFAYALFCRDVLGYHGY